METTCLIILAYIAGLIYCKSADYRSMTYNPANCVRQELFDMEGYVCLEISHDATIVAPREQKVSRTYVCPDDASEPCKFMMRITRDFTADVKSNDPNVDVRDTEFDKDSEAVIPKFLEMYGKDLVKRTRKNETLAEKTVTGSSVDCSVPPGQEGWLVQRPLFENFPVNIRRSYTNSVVALPIHETWSVILKFPIVSPGGVNVGKLHCHHTGDEHTLADLTGKQEARMALPFQKS